MDASQRIGSLSTNCADLTISMNDVRNRFFLTHTSPFTGCIDTTRTLTRPSRSHIAIAEVPGNPQRSVVQNSECQTVGLTYTTRRPPRRLSGSRISSRQEGEPVFRQKHREKKEQVQQRLPQDDEMNSRWQLHQRLCTKLPRACISAKELSSFLLPRFKFLHKKSPLSMNWPRST